MQMKKGIGLIVALVSIFLITGCSGPQGPTRISFEPRKEEEKITIQKLKTEWQNYQIYYTGINLEQPTGVMFDPKDENTISMSDRWTQVEDENSLKELLEWMELRYTTARPYIWRIRGSGGKVFGYLYTPTNSVRVKQIDENTMYVFDIYF